MAIINTQSATNMTAPADEQVIINSIRDARREADDGKRKRKGLNRMNWAAYFGQQDFSYKQPGQSKEFLPKVPVAAEQFAAFVQRGLVQFGDWFSVDVPPDAPLKDYEVRELMKCFLDYLVDVMRERTSFALRVADGCKVSLFEAVMTFKVHGFRVPERVFQAERGLRLVESDGTVRQTKTSSLKQKFLKPWRLAIDLIQADDYFPDPTGRKLYEIHRVERDLHDVMELADQGLYDPDVVDQIISDFDERYKQYQDQLTRNQQGVTPPAFRKTVIIDEYWGDLLDNRGHLIERNIVSAVANDKYLIREPEPNPYWHGESPFVSIPLVRVPSTVWHKALFDHASPLNFAINEIFNLMLDGGLASVWGNKQLRAGFLEDPRQVANGIPQGMTLVVKDDLPAGEKVLETVATGQVPPDAIAMYQNTDREFNAAALSNDLKMGFLPKKDVKATEIVEIQQSQGVTMDAITFNMDEGISKILYKAWLCILQNANNLDAADVVAAVGSKAALTLSRMSPAERFAAFARGFEFKAYGLQSTLARARDFQKAMALAQTIPANPMLAEPFMRRFSPDKFLDFLVRALNLNPDKLGIEPAELMTLNQRMGRMGQLAQMFGTQPAGTSSMKQAESGGSPALPAEINQAGNPLSGMAG